MPEDRKVVAIVSPEHLHSREVGLFAARIMPMGLTGYGHTKEEATRKVKRMFAAMVKAHRLMGDLEQWLDRSDTEWHWLDEYSGDVPVEYPEAVENGDFREVPATTTPAPLRQTPFPLRDSSVPTMTTPAPWSEVPTETGIAA